MDDRSLKNFTRLAFYGVAALALIINGVLDYRAYITNQKSDEYGSQVREAVLANNSLSAFERSLYSQNSKGPELGYLDRYENLVPELKTVVSVFRGEGVGSPNLSQAIQEARVKIDGLIEQRYQQDQELDLRVENQLMVTLGLDFFLFAVLIAVFNWNVSAKRKVEEALRRSQKSLMNTLLVLETNAAKRMIETKSIVHDLRNPIGTIKGFAELLHDEPNSERTVLEASERIQKISERSLQLVEGLLNNQDETPPLHLLELNFLVEEVCDRMQILAEGKGQRIVFSSTLPSALVRGNELKLDELASNLISNAIKYSPKGATIKVSLSHSNTEIRLEVKDRGPGFTESDKLKAFGFGQRLSAVPTAGETSSGIGMYVVKKIVELHDSKIYIEDNTDGKGATLVVDFPRTYAALDNLAKNPVKDLS